MRWLEQLMISFGVKRPIGFDGLILGPAVDDSDAKATILRMKTAILVALMICSGCSDACQNTVASSSLSPDGNHAAVLFQRDCGATTGFSTQISILDANGKPSGVGNAFVADGDHGAARIGDWEGPWAEMTWLSPDRLLIRYAEKSRLFKQKEQVSGVNITYQIVGR